MLPERKTGATAKAPRSFDCELRCHPHDIGRRAILDTVQFTRAKSHHASRFLELPSSASPLEASRGRLYPQGHARLENLYAN